MPNPRGAGRRRAEHAVDESREPRSIHLDDVLRARALIGGTDHEALADLFGALADPTRLAIVEVLLAQEMCTSDLAATLSVSEPAVSQHLRVLRNLGVVSSRRAGRIVYYTAGDRSVRKLVEVARKRIARQVS
jgi:DNA-binding transcriptional ArsR family regulator